MKRKFIVEYTSYIKSKTFAESGLKNEYIGEIVIDDTDSVCDSLLVKKVRELLQNTNYDLYDWCFHTCDDLLVRLKEFNTNGDIAFNKIIDFVKQYNARVFVQYHSDAKLFKDFEDGFGARGFVCATEWALINVYETDILPTTEEVIGEKMEIIIKEILELKKEIKQNRDEIKDLKDKIGMYYKASLM